MKLIDVETNVVVYEFKSNHRLTVDEALDSLPCVIAKNGRIKFEGKLINAYRDNLEIR